MNLNRLTVLLHRWIGAVLCLLFAAWFFSGMVLMYVPFPSLGQADRLSHSTAVDASGIAVAPGQALQAANAATVSRLRLIDRDGQAVYVVHPEQGPVSVIGADDGQPVPPLPADAAQRIARNFSGSEISSIQGPLDYDQWVVSNDFDAYRPFYRVRLDDGQATELYITQTSGEVIQRTNRTQRGWNYLGAVVHWIYPTALRKNWAAWDQVVWWLSLAGIIGALLGAWLGIIRMRDALRFKGRGASPFRGWLRWHHILGLFAGVFVVTWIFSGWLSMDHGRLFLVPYPTAQLTHKVRGMTLEQAAEGITPTQLQALGRFREVELTAIGSTPLLIARQASGQQIHLVADQSAPASEQLSIELIGSALRSAWPEAEVQSIGWLEPADAYTQLRAGSQPASTVQIKLDDPAESWVHIDASSGEILSVIDRSRRTYRWLFNGLHSLDFPGLVNRRPLWDGVMLVLLTLGLVFSLTGVVIGLKRIKTTWKKSRSRQAA